MGTMTAPSTAPAKLALVGEFPGVEVEVNGQLISYLLDTGSQITLFIESLFQRQLGKFTPRRRQNG